MPHPTVLTAPYMGGGGALPPTPARASLRPLALRQLQDGGYREHLSTPPSECLPQSRTLWAGGEEAERGFMKGLLCLQVLG